MEGYYISTKKDDMDLSVIHGFITNTYWAKGIPLSTMEKAINNSLCFGVFSPQGAQVGFARMVTDKATFAYLADVFILPTARGLGLSKWLMEHVIHHQDLQGLRRMVLATRDAHGLYERYGFEPIDNPDIFMQIIQPDIYG